MKYDNDGPKSLKELERRKLDWEVLILKYD